MTSNMNTINDDYGQEEAYQAYQNEIYQNQNVPVQNFNEDVNFGNDQCSIIQNQNS